MEAVANMSSRRALLFIAVSLLIVDPVMAADVQFRIIPVTTSGASDLLSSNPPSSVALIPSGATWFAEIWGSDVNDATNGSTGLIAAYLDVLYTPVVGATVSALHSSLFPAFLATEPSIDIGKGSILNFGGVTARLDQPKGIAPDWVRIGRIRFEGMVVTTPTILHLTGRTGVGGVGCYGRSTGAVDVGGADVVITPEPQSLLVFVALLGSRSFCLPRRIRRPRGSAQ